MCGLLYNADQQLKLSVKNDFWQVKFFKEKLWSIHKNFGVFWQLLLSRDKKKIETCEKHMGKFTGILTLLGLHDATLYNWP